MINGHIEFNQELRDWTRVFSAFVPRACGLIWFGFIQKCNSLKFQIPLWREFKNEIMMLLLTLRILLRDATAQQKDFGQKCLDKTKQTRVFILFSSLFFVTPADHFWAFEATNKRLKSWKSRHDALLLPDSRWRSSSCSARWTVFSWCWEPQRLTHQSAGNQSGHFVRLLLGKGASLFRKRVCSDVFSQGGLLRLSL